MYTTINYFFLGSLSYNLLKVGVLPLTQWKILENTEIMKLMYNNNKYVYLKKLRINQSCDRYSNRYYRRY
jgi:hypothetical protein